MTPDIGKGGDPHTEKAGQTRGEGPEHETEADEGMGIFEIRVSDGQKHSHHDHKNAQHLVFTGQEGHGALLDVTGDDLHLLISGVLALDPLGLVEGENKRQYTGGGDEVNHIFLLPKGMIREFGPIYRVKGPAIE